MIKSVGWPCKLLPALVLWPLKQLRQYNILKQIHAYKFDPYYILYFDASKMARCIPSVSLGPQGK